MHLYVLRFDSRLQHKTTPVANHTIQYTLIILYSIYSPIILYSVGRPASLQKHSSLLLFFTITKKKQYQLIVHFLSPHYRVQKDGWPRSQRTLCVDGSGVGVVHRLDEHSTPQLISHSHQTHTKDHRKRTKYHILRQSPIYETQKRSQIHNICHKYVW